MAVPSSISKDGTDSARLESMQTQIAQASQRLGLCSIPSNAEGPLPDLVKGLQALDNLKTILLAPAPAEEQLSCTEGGSSGSSSSSSGSTAPPQRADEEDTAATATAPAQADGGCKGNAPKIEALQHTFNDLHQSIWSLIHRKRPAADALVEDGETASKPEALPLWLLRELLAICCSVQALLLARRPSQQTLKEALRLADLGLIVGGPETEVSSVLFELTRGISQALSSESSQDEEEETGLPLKRFRAAQDQLVAAKPSIMPLVHRPAKEADRHNMPAFENFLLGPYTAQTPIIFRGGCTHWPAYKRWNSQAYWGGSSCLGQRWVAVEMDYWLDQGFELMQLRDFVSHCSHVEASDDKKAGLSGGGYLAQCALLDQIPELQDDIVMPDYCLCGGGTILRQMFFGPKCTVTPAHWDPYENIFCQVVGYKYLRLFPPSEAAKLYPRKENLQNNSSLDPADILEGERDGAYTAEQSPFKRFLEAEFVDMVLEPGDMLYLPKGWWHFVKSLSTSISLAFHFT